MNSGWGSPEKSVSHFFRGGAMAHCMIHGAPEKISVVFLNDLFLASWRNGRFCEDFTMVIKTGWQIMCLTKGMEGTL